MNKISNNEFKTKVTVELDTTKAEKQLSELSDKKIKIDVDTGGTTKNIDDIHKSINSTKKTTTSFGNTLKKSLNIGTAATITAKGFQLINQAAREAVKSVKDFDTAIKDLRMATGDSYDNTSKLVQTYNNMGKTIGSTTLEISDAANSWLRQGHSIADTNTLIRDSMILSKVANLESAESASFLTSIMKGYEIEVENVIGALDKLVSVDLISATDAGGLAEAMSRTSVNANMAGISIDKLLGYIATVGEVTQKSMSTVGESFKTIFSRMSDIKAEKLELIDEDGTTEMLSDVEQTLANVGIDLRSTVNEYANYGDVLDSLASKWDSLSKVQQNALTKAFAGVRQSENFRVLMENYESAKKYTEAASKSAGTAEQKFEAYLDSIEAKTKSLQAAFESLAINSFSTEMFSGIIDATSSVVTFLDQSNLLKGTLVGLTASGAIKGFSMLATGIANASIRLNEFNSALKLVKTGNIGENDVQMLARMTANLSQSQLKAVISSKALSTEQRIAILTTQGLSKSEAEAALASMGLATAEGVASTATNTFSGAIKGLWATLKANPLILVVSAVTTAVSIFSTLKQKSEESAAEIKNTFQEARSELSSIKSELEETKKRIEELNALDSLSPIEQNELENLEKANTKLEYQYKLKKQIADLSQQEVAKNANDELTKNTYWSTGQNLDVIDITSYYLSDKNKAEQTYYNLMKQGASEDSVKYWEDTVVNYEKLIADNLEIINEYYSDLLDIEGNALPGYEDTVSRIEAVIESTADSMSELDAETQNTTDSIKDQENAVKSLGDQLTEIGNLSEGFDALGKIYNDVKDGGGFDVGALFDKKFIETFSGLGDAYTNFMQVIGESPNDISACQGAFNELVTAFINNSDALDGLSEETKDVTVAYLEQMGVANAAEIVDRQLALQKARLSLETEAYTNKTYKEIIAEYKEAEAGSVAEQALAELALTKLNVNGATIITSGDIDQIIALANAANASTASLQNLAKAKQLIAQAESYENDPYLQNHPFASERIEAYRNQAQNLLNQPLEYEEIDSSKFKVNYTGGASSKGDSSSKDPSSFDWIEIAVKRVESAINKLKNTASSAYNALKTRLSATSDQITKVNEEIDLQNEAYKRYMQEANSVGLSKDLAAKVRDGSININEYNSETSDLIKKYQDWYNKATECSEAIDELHESLADLYSDRFDTISKDFDNQLSLIEHDAKTYENRISEYEERGYLNTKRFYESLMKIEQNNLSTLKEELKELNDAFDMAMASGEIKEGSEAWHDMNSEILATEEAIQESILSMLEFANSIREIDWEIFEFLQDQISNVNSEAEFLISLMGNKKMFDKNGQITDEGFATVGLHGMAHNVYMRQADDYAKKISEVNDELAKDPNNTTLVAKKQEYLELQREAILAAEEEKQAIIDLVEEGFEVELDYLNELIEKYTDALDSAKSLHDYQKKIEGITDEISSIERQIIAYSGNDSEEGKLKLQELTKSLKESQSELEDAEYDQYISDQKALLDDLYEEYEKILNERLDDIDTLLKNVYDAINTNAATIETTLSGIASEVGIELTKSMASIWDVESTQASGDVNSDGEITAADARLALRAAAGLENLSDEAMKNADVNSDGEVTAADARMILRVAAGLDELPTNRVISIYGDEFSDQLTSVNSVLDSIYKDVAFISTNIKGDLNKDGVVTEEDAEMIIKVSGQKNASDYLGYDMNNDGKVNAADARIILQMANGKISGFSSGGYIADLQRVAYNNGDDIVTVNTLKRGEAVLTPEQATQFKSLVSNLTTLTGIVDFSKQLDELRDIQVQKHIFGELFNNVSGDTHFHIAIDHVEDYDDFVNKLKNDTKFEKMVQSMTVDRIVGKSSMAKNKYNW